MCHFWDLTPNAFINLQTLTSSINIPNLKSINTKFILAYDISIPNILSVLANSQIFSNKLKYTFLLLSRLYMWSGVIALPLSGSGVIKYEIQNSQLYQSRQDAVIGLTWDTQWKRQKIQKGCSTPQYLSHFVVTLAQMYYRKHSNNLWTVCVFPDSPSDM